MTTDPALVEELTTEVISRVAPEELFLVEGFATRSTEAGRTSQGPQGFGAGEAIALALPLVHLFFSKAFEGAASQIGKDAYAVVRSLIRPVGSAKIDREELRTAVEACLAEEKLPVDRIHVTSAAIVDAVSAKLSPST